MEKTDDAQLEKMQVDAETHSADVGAQSTPAKKLPLIDRTQQSVNSVVRGTSLWFDSFFGSSEINQASNVRKGSVRLGAEWDERDGTKVIARMKARVPLPVFRERSRLILGRGDAEEFVDGSSTSTMESLPSQFNDFEDDDWLLGIGYSQDSQLLHGFDLGVGIKLSTPLEPYVRTTYRWNRTYHDAWLWQLRPRVFWQSQRGAGASVTSIVDYAVDNAWLLRAWSVISTEDDIEGMGWQNDFIAYQNLNSRAAFSYSLFASGETGAEVALQDYGMELRFRKRIAREYLFIELSTRLNWPRYFLNETRNANFGVGVEIEMQFGDWPGRRGTAPTSAESTVM